MTITVQINERPGRFHIGWKLTPEDEDTERVTILGVRLFLHIEDVAPVFQKGIWGYIRWRIDMLSAGCSPARSSRKEIIENAQSQRRQREYRRSEIL